MPVSNGSVLELPTSQAIFEHMLNGVAYCRVIFDRGRAVDFVFHYTNPAFSTLTGLDDVCGRRVVECLPRLRESDPEFFDFYGRVAVTGVAERAELEVNALGQWFSISAYCPRPGYVVAVFDVITRRKLAERAMAESEARFRHFAAMTSDVFYACRRGADGLFRVEWLGGCVERVFGLTPEAFMALGCWRTLLVEEDRPLFDRHITRLALGQSSDLILRARHQDGSLRHLRSCAVVDRGEAGHGAGQLYGALQDVSEAVCAEAALRETLAEAERFRVALDHAPSYVYIKDAQGRYVYGNRATLELFGCTGEALAGRDDHSFFAPETAARIRAIDRRVLAGETTREELEVRGGGLADERVFWQEKAPIYADAARRVVWGLCGVSTDITARKRLERALELQANTDSLTGLDSRAHFLDVAGKALARLRRHPAPMALVMLDLDHFKRVNDRYGHEVGDRVLVAFARVCRQNLREIDLMGRLGGEEFAVLLPDTGGAQAREVVERLLGAVAAVELRVDGRPPIRMTASAGLAICGEGDGNMDALLNRADAALYEAKRLGRNRLVVAAGA